jgi:uncharacterized SAM-binding protein YcdF (DUF218 family)
MSTGRVLWIIWCLSWFGFWIIFGWFLPGINLVCAALSLALIALPIGKTPLKKNIEDVKYTTQQIPSSVYDPRFSTDEKNEQFKEKDY